MQEIPRAWMSALEAMWSAEDDEWRVCGSAPSWSAFQHPEQLNAIFHDLQQWYRAQSEAGVGLMIVERQRNSEWRLLSDAFIHTLSLPHDTRLLRPTMRTSALMVIHLQPDGVTPLDAALRLKAQGTVHLQSHTLKDALYTYEHACYEGRHVGRAEQRRAEVESLLTASLSNISLCALKLQHWNLLVNACNAASEDAALSVKSHARLGACFEASLHLRAAQYHYTQSAKLAPSISTYADVARVTQRLASHDPHGAASTT